MSMIVEYVRLQPYELAELLRLLVEDPDSAYEYAGDLRTGDDEWGCDSPRLLAVALICRDPGGAISVA